MKIQKVTPPHGAPQKVKNALKEIENAGSKHAQVKKVLDESEKVAKMAQEVNDRPSPFAKTVRNIVQKLNWLG